MSDVVREIMYARNILYSLGITVGLPIVVKVDNLGAIYVANNAGISVRTKYVDIRYYFVREYLENGVVLVQFVNSSRNKSDIMTKNTTSSTFNTHVPSFMGILPN